MKKNSKVDEKKIQTPISDVDMEEPQTKEYVEPEKEEGASVAEEGNGTTKIYFKPEFKEALLRTIGTLGYDRAIGSPEFSVRVNQIFDAYNNIESHNQGLTEEQANNFIALIAKAPYNLICDVIENIRNNASMYFEFKSE